MKKIILLLIIALMLTSCTKSNSTATGDTNTKPVIFTTIYPLQYIIDRLAGTHVTVKSLIPLGGDPHTFEPTQKQLIELSKSDMYFFLGLGLEQAASSIGTSIKTQKVKTVEVGKAFYKELNYDPAVPKVEGGKDNDSNMHIWIDPSYDIKMSAVIKDELVKQYPQWADEINNNYTGLVKDFTNIDEKYKSVLTNTRIKTIIVSHDAFRHLDKYGISTIAVKDESHSKDPTQKELNNIIEVGNSQKIEYVLYEQNIPCTPLDVVMKALQAKKLVISNLAVLTKENVSNNKDMLSLMNDNLQVLVQALS